MSKTNSKLRTQNSKLAPRAFTLVELMIVVSILGILAAIVLPEFQNHVQQAKEAAAKDSLRILRESINRYAVEHNNTPPGYSNGDTSSNPLDTFFIIHLTNYTSAASGVSVTKSGTYCYGPYLPKMPVNPFNDKATISIVSDGANFPASPVEDVGWMYQGSSKTIRLAYDGTDSQGNAYYSY